MWFERARRPVGLQQPSGRRGNETFHLQREGARAPGVRGLIGIQVRWAPGEFCRELKQYGAQAPSQQETQKIHSWSPVAPGLTPKYKALRYASP